MKGKLILVGLGLVAAAGCSKPESKNENANTGSEAAKVGSVSILTDPLAALNLSASLSPAVPASVSAKGTGAQSGQSALTLTEKKKSREACNIRQKIREAKMNQESMAMDLCFIEAQKGMKAGGKYKLKFGGGGGGPDGPGEPGADGGMDPGFPGGEGGPGPMALQSPGMEMTRSVFLDNSDAANFKVFMCDNDKLTQKIVLGGAGDKGSKGSFKAKFGEEGFTVAMVGSFDNGVGAADRSRVSSQMSFSMKFGEDTSHMRSSMTLDLDGSGVSTVKVANESSNSFGDFSAADKEIGVALIGPNFGSALFQRTFDGSGSFPGGPDGSGEPPVIMLTKMEQSVETSRAFFDNAGMTVEKTDSENFATDGKLEVKETMFPKLLPTDFTVEFEAGDWDCSGTEDFTPDESSDGFKACEEKFASSFSDESCDTDVYGLGFEEDIDSMVDLRSEIGVIPEFPEDAPPPGDVPPPQ